MNNQEYWKRPNQTIALSSTYRQSSAATDDKLTRDPENLYYSRANRFQLPAEMLRDNALLTSGLLVDKQGGPSVKPYEVAESFKPVARGKGEPLLAVASIPTGEGQFPWPVTMTLDAAKREVCSVAHERTSNPLHAIVLLNDPQYIEAARKMGENLVKEFGDDHQAALAHAFRVLQVDTPTKLNWMSSRTPSNNNSLTSRLIQKKRNNFSTRVTHKGIPNCLPVR